MTKKLKRRFLTRNTLYMISKLIAIARSKLDYRSRRKFQTSFLKRSDHKQSTFCAFITQFHSPFPNPPTPTLIVPYSRLQFPSSMRQFQVPVSPRNKSGRSSQLARPTVPATVSKSAETPYIRITEEKVKILGGRV